MLCRTGSGTPGWQSERGLIDFFWGGFASGAELKGEAERTHFYASVHNRVPCLRGCVTFTDRIPRDGIPPTSLI
jgi:hypothetical protein